MGAKYKWDAKSIRALRRHLGMTQQQMSEELGVRQQTVSDWELGYHRPRGGMARLLSIVAERANFVYEAQGKDTPSQAGDPHGDRQAGEETDGEEPSVDGTETCE